MKPAMKLYGYFAFNIFRYSVLTVTRVTLLLTSSKIPEFSLYIYFYFGIKQCVQNFPHCFYLFKHILCFI